MMLFLSLSLPPLPLKASSPCWISRWLFNIEGGAASLVGLKIDVGLKIPLLLVGWEGRVGRAGGWAEGLRLKEPIPGMGSPIRELASPASLLLDCAPEIFLALLVRVWMPKKSVLNVR